MHAQMANTICTSRPNWFCGAGATQPPSRPIHGDSRMRVNMYPEVMTSERKMVEMAHGQMLSRMVIPFPSRRATPSAMTPAPMVAHRSHANGVLYGMGTGVAFESSSASG